MARPFKRNPIDTVTVTREDGAYIVRIVDQGGKTSVYSASSDQAFDLADNLDALIADEDAEKQPVHLRADAPCDPSSQSGIVKWYNSTKGFGFITPELGGNDIFVHRSVLEQARVASLPAGARVRFTITEGAKGPTVGAIYPQS